MMPMVFEVSSSVTLLFDFWHVNSPGGMFVSVLVVMLLTILYEMLKVWRLWLGRGPSLKEYSTPYAGTPSHQIDNSSVLENSHSESSLTTGESSSFFPNNKASWLLHGIQTLLHFLQVTLGYMLMLCVMSFNTWIFLGVILGSALGYFISFPLLEQFR
ncbi:probable low affinity copper uptake protein 2 [Corythoichthys intestinalis]|uniref:probable low affinity copper uptake protein 2 n=1 Tax=Corythoichthys intestinalis TaxID=161448 RepID=UPI0025A5B62B|nr:probable low affinity copper uptake protein 2 [Corythoichthys intestinalis]XP_061800173.1 protein SLC31A2-like [Nerophis lumbriciformis]